MYLTALADAIKTAIESAPDSSFPGEEGQGLKIGTTSGRIPVFVALDPFTQLMAGQAHSAGIFVIPGNKEYNIDNNTARNVSIKKRAGHVIRLALSVRLKEQTPEKESYDVAPASEWRKLTCLKDDLDELISTTQIPGANLTSMETAPPDEVQLDSNRYYLVQTELIYDAC